MNLVLGGWCARWWRTTRDDDGRREDALNRVSLRRRMLPEKKNRCFLTLLFPAAAVRFFFFFTLLDAHGTIYYTYITRAFYYKKINIGMRMYICTVHFNTWVHVSDHPYCRSWWFCSKIVHFVDHKLHLISL